MIKATELRIGNYFIGNDGNYYKVIEIKRGAGNGFPDYYFGGINSHSECLTDKPLPIKITSDILKRCGFYSNNGNEFIHPKLTGLIFLNPNSFNFNSISAKELHIDAPDNLHQLQNLYYAITGEELTVNL